jgi:hypothetical protein
MIAGWGRPGRAKMVGMTDPADGITPALRELVSADVVAFGGVGLMSRVLPVTEAYRTFDRAIARDGVALRPHVDWLLTHATPAGKVYAAALMQSLDPAAGRAAWQSLAKERAEITTFVGCVRNRTSLAEYAGDRLAGLASA